MLTNFPNVSNTARNQNNDFDSLFRSFSNMVDNLEGIIRSHTNEPDIEAFEKMTFADIDSIGTDRSGYSGDLSHIDPLTVDIDSLNDARTNALSLEEIRALMGSVRPVPRVNHPQIQGTAISESSDSSGDDDSDDVSEGDDSVDISEGASDSDESDESNSYESGDESRGGTSSSEYENDRESTESGSRNTESDSTAEEEEHSSTEDYGHGRINLETDSEDDQRHVSLSESDDNRSDDRVVRMNLSSESDIRTHSSSESDMRTESFS